MAESPGQTRLAGVRSELQPQHRGAIVVTKYSLMLSSRFPPEETVALARAAESAGFPRLWLTEDYYRKGAFASCGAVLGATDRLTVGLGVTSLYVRHPTTLAMEIATLHRMFGSRFEPGVGLGSPRALRGSHRMPTAVIFSTSARLAVLRDLLSGATVNWSDEFDTVGEATLEYPGTVDAPLWLAAEGPQMLALARDHADGVVFSAFSTTHYLDWAVPILSANPACRSVTYLHVSVHDDPDVAAVTARSIVRSRIEAGYSSSSMTRSGWWEVVEPLLGAASEEIDAALTDELVAAFVVHGTAADCRAKLAEFEATGVDEIALAPTFGNDPTALARAVALLGRELSGH